MLEFLASFLARAAARLTRIARATKSELKGKDFQGEVWFAAAEIGEKRGRPVDFEDTVDQELVLSRVYTQARRQRDWRLQSAVSFDADCDTNYRWSDRIEEVVTTDPLARWLKSEAAIDEAAAIASSYSQATAYFIVLGNFNNDRPNLCTHLVITPGSLEYRINNAARTVMRQSSLFDGLENIDPAFMPQAGRELVSKEEVAVEAEQCELTF